VLGGRNVRLRYANWPTGKPVNSYIRSRPISSFVPRIAALVEVAVERRAGAHPCRIRMHPIGARRHLNALDIQIARVEVGHARDTLPGARSPLLQSLMSSTREFRKQLVEETTENAVTAVRRPHECTISAAASAAPAHKSRATAPVQSSIISAIKSRSSPQATRWRIRIANWSVWRFQNA